MTANNIHPTTQNPKHNSLPYVGIPYVGLNQGIPT